MGQTHPARGFTLAEMLVAGAIAVLLLLVAAALLSMHGRRPDHSRVWCDMNLKGIGTALHTYAASNQNRFPNPPHAAAVRDEVGSVTYAPGKIGAHRGSASDPESGKTSDEDTEMSVTRCLYLLARSSKTCPPKSFICPSSTDQAADDPNWTSYRDFGKYSEISYGYQVPFGKHGLARTDSDGDLAIAADKGPYGAALESKQLHPGAPSLSSEAAPEKWQKYNSPNHGGEGQNVLYNDAHCDWVPTPLAGVKKDNIYTRWSRADGGTDADSTPRVQGTPPSGIETPWSDTDSLIYP